MTSVVSTCETCNALDIIAMDRQTLNLHSEGSSPPLNVRETANTINTFLSSCPYSSESDAMARVSLLILPLLVCLLAAGVPYVIQQQHHCHAT